MAERAASALIAHDQKKDEMAGFARGHAARLAKFAAAYDIPMALNRRTAGFLIGQHALPGARRS